MPALPAQYQNSWFDDKPLPQAPGSPTLTIPENILPSSSIPKLSSPPRLTRRPPSPSYLRDRDDGGHKREKLRPPQSRLATPSRTSPQGSQGGGDFLASSPTLRDDGPLAPQQDEHLRVPGSGRRSNSPSSTASDMTGLESFLAKYPQPAGTSDEETADEEGEDGREDSYALQEEADAERRRQREEEYNSAILSKRAEQILADAKKRLNVMEGNLRGARDLVAPLTAANLKRATSLGSAPFAPVYPRRHWGNSYEHDALSQKSAHVLQTQTSSPNIGLDYQLHTRGFSETEIPERPSSSFDHGPYAMPPGTRTLRSAEPLFSSGLRSARSYDSLGSASIGYAAGRSRPLHSRASPDSSYMGLEPLPEAEEYKRSFRPNRDSMSNHGLGIYRPSSRASSRASDLRDQMTTLKSKISNLRERAKKESFRRQSQSSLRSATPFNDALDDAPELFHSSSPGPSSSGISRDPGTGWASNSTSSVAPKTPISGSHNVFPNRTKLNDPTKSVHEPEHNNDIAVPQSPEKSREQTSGIHQNSSRATRTSNADDAEDDLTVGNSHTDIHKPESSQEEVKADEVGSSAGSSSDPDESSPPESEASASQDDGGYEPSEDGESVYEDADDEFTDVPDEEAPREQVQSDVIAHEDRVDAFDYKQFFLMNAMRTYGNHGQDSRSSKGSVSSAETAKGPAHGDDEENNFDDDSSLYPSWMPSTPEKLKSIERHLGERPFSKTSNSSINTYATADELPDYGSRGGANGRRSAPPMGSIRHRGEGHGHGQSASFSQIPLRQSSNSTDSGANSRPGTAVRHVVRRDSSSERADSGVGLPRRSDDSCRPSTSSTTPKPTGVSTPPTSPLNRARQDPASVAVNALLDPNGKALGLRNKAALFGVVESLRKAVQQLQDEQGNDDEAHALWRRLEEAKSTLEGSKSG